jgi:hypothetical protein
MHWKKAYQANTWGVLGGEPVGVTSIKDLFYRTFHENWRSRKDWDEHGQQPFLTSFLEEPDGISDERHRSEILRDAKQVGEPVTYA